MRRNLRLGVIWSFAGMCLLLGASTGSAQPPKLPSAPPQPANRSVTTEDGVKIWFTYYESNQGREAPVVVFLHSQGVGNRVNWKNGLPEKLQSKGFAVITVDLRQHGDSRTDKGNANQPDTQRRGARKPVVPDLTQAEYEAMAAYDMEAIKGFIFEEHQKERLNMNKMGIVGVEMGASIAAYYALLDWAKQPYLDGLPGSETPRGQDVRALVLISPQKNFHGLAIAKPLNDLRDPNSKIAFLFCTGKSDTQDKGQTKALFDQVGAFGGKDGVKEGAKDVRIYFREYPGALRGIDLVTGREKQAVEGNIVAFLEKHLKELDAPWRDRQSKLDKQ